MIMPQFSILIVTLNAEKSIIKTVNSVICQTCNDYELIVKDGFSNDNTVSLIQKDTKIKIIQMKDSGIYDAMNQASKIANGNYLCFLNAGDEFYSPYVLEDIKKVITNDDSQCMIYYGDYYKNGVAIKQPEKLTKFSLFRNQLNHQSMFFSHELFIKEDTYNTEYHILADYDLTVRTFFSGMLIKHIHIIIDKYEGNGISESKNGIILYKNENNAIRKKYYKRKYYIYLIIFRISMPGIRRTLASKKMPLFIRKAYRKISNWINSSL